MIESYKKIIRNYILPQFPWIVDFKITISKDESFVNVVYIPKSEKGVFTTSEDFLKLENLTIDALKMLGRNNVNVYFQSIFKSLNIQI